MSSHTVEPSLPPPGTEPERPAHRTDFAPAPAERPGVRLLDRFATGVQTHAVALLRVSVGLIFVGFGVLKLFPAASPAEELAVEAATKLTLDLVPATVLLLGLAALETAIGIGLIVGRRLLRPALIAFFLHMGGVFSTLVLLPEAMWQPHSFAPTMECQYVIKNVPLIVICLVVAADTWRRGPRRRPGAHR